MTTFYRFLILGFCTVSLSGCVNRQQADDMLVKGCLAGVKALLPEGETAGSVKDKSFSASPEGPSMRHVKLTMGADEEGWIGESDSYECIFDETFGFMNSSYTASIYQVRVADQIYGKSGNQIQGSFDDFVKLTDAIREAMYE